MRRLDSGDSNDAPGRHDSSVTQMQKISKEQYKQGLVYDQIPEESREGYTETYEEEDYYDQEYSGNELQEELIPKPKV